jgi:site-specific DNA-methyltransferase (adenine-specific)
MVLHKILNTIIEGDILSVLKELPDNCIDITITSPPYNKRNKSQGWLVTNKTYSHFDDHMEEDAYQEWQLDIMKELMRITKPEGSLFYNHKLRWENGYLLHPFSWICKSEWLVRQEIIWDRGLAANMRGWRFWQVDERIYWLYKPKGKSFVGQEIESRHAKHSSIWRLKPTPRTESHPAPFPLEIPLRVIYSMPGERKIILDPFCGTGTTLVAAKLLNHDYIGIDISPEYAALARQRLENSEEELVTVQKELIKHKIDDPFISRKDRGTVNWPFGPKNGSKTPIKE